MKNIEKKGKSNNREKLNLTTKTNQQILSLFIKNLTKGTTAKPTSTTNKPSYNDTVSEDSSHLKYPLFQDVGGCGWCGVSSQQRGNDRACFRCGAE